MLNDNKTYDNSNLRDVAKSFNDGVVILYNADERILGEQKAQYNYSRESVSYETYQLADQNSRTAVIAIGIPYGGPTIEHGDIAKINDEYYMVNHVQYKDYNHPNWYKVFMTRSTIPFVSEDESNAQV